MINQSTNHSLQPGQDCRELFRKAYENRYTWDQNFQGYQGRCSYHCLDKVVKGKFLINSDLKYTVDQISDETIAKKIESQLWEVSIHRVRRTFEQSHADNTFTVASINDSGIEILVGGKNKGDKYCVSNNIVTLVHRHIHGKLVNISTISTIDTGEGYVGNEYQSQYFDPKTLIPVSGLVKYIDTFKKLESSPYWVLSKRVVEAQPFQDSPEKKEIFSFLI